MKKIKPQMDANGRKYFFQNLCIALAAQPKKLARSYEVTKFYIILLRNFARKCLRRFYSRSFAFIRG